MNISEVAQHLVGENTSVTHPSPGCSVCQIKDDTGSMEMTIYDVFPGVCLIYNDVHIYSVMKQFNLPARIFMESTGIYHFPVYHKMREAGLDAYVLNPLVTHASKDINVRNIHNDKFDAQKIALLGLRPDLKTSIVPSDDVAAMKAILREYYPQ